MHPDATRMRHLHCALLAFATATSPAAAQTTDYSAAATYSRTHRGDALVVLRGDSIVFEEYQNGYRADSPHMLASGSKSFSCAIAIAAVKQGLLQLDEPVARTITEWAGDSIRERITVRMLLDLSSGLEAGVNAFDGGPLRFTLRSDAIRARVVSAPGTVFRYGPNHYDVFGELIRRKTKGETPDVFLQRNVLDRIGLTGLEWRRDREGMPALAGGAFTTAREWLKYGRLIRDEGRWQGEQILDRELLRECATPSPANSNYGLTFWLSTDAMADLAGRARAASPAVRAQRGRRQAGELRLIMAAGAGVQRLYVLREHNLVVVRLGRADPSWSDAEFVRLFSRS